MMKELYTRTEIQCKHACQEITECELYTFIEPVYDCILLQNVSSFDKSFMQGILSGPKKCTSENGICKFSLLDNRSHTMLSETIRLKSWMLDCTVNNRLGQGGIKNLGGSSGFVNSTLANLDPYTSLEILFDDNGNVKLSADFLRK
jgi:hypothetical protein